MDMEEKGDIMLLFDLKNIKAIIFFKDCEFKKSSNWNKENTFRKFN
jgi:hypothetical protein